MVKKQPITLKEKCLQLVSVNVWKFCYACVFCIELEHPLSVVTAKRVLSNLPQTVIRDIFNHILSSHEYKLYCRKLLEIARFNSESLRVDKLYWMRKFKRDQTNILYFVSLILRVDENSIRSIEFSCETEEEMFFVSKFGKSINSIRFKNPTLYRAGVAGWLNASNFRMILGSASNIQELNLHGVNYTEQFLKIIGEECNQLKVLKGVEVDKEVLNSEGHNNSGLTIQYSRFMKLDKLLFNSGNERNMCCDSLQSVHLLIRNRPIHEAADLKIIYNTVTFLICNLPNLKSLGDRFNLDSYLRSLRCNEITETNLEEIYIEKLTCDIIPILSSFCLKVKKIIVDDTSRIENQHQLSKFDFLEDLYVRCSDISSLGTDQMQSNLVSIQWPTLKKLTLCDIYYVNITSLALHFPKLTELDIQAGNFIWDYKTNFKCLEKFKLHYLYEGEDISWFKSFSNTIAHINVTGAGSFNADTFLILLRVPFPCLECLSIEPLPYNFLFYTSVLKSLPKLRICEMDEYDKPIRTQRVQELSKFLKENNLECDIRRHLKYVK